MPGKEPVKGGRGVSGARGRRLGHERDVDRISRPLVSVDDVAVGLAVATAGGRTADGPMRAVRATA